jgi:hypothetical protein
MGTRTILITTLMMLRLLDFAGAACNAPADASWSVHSVLAVKVIAMPANRIGHLQPLSTARATPEQVGQMIPPGFTLCPPQFMVVHVWQQEIYRRAYEQAKRATEVPRFHRILFSVWN